MGTGKGGVGCSREATGDRGGWEVLGRRQCSEAEGIMYHIINHRDVS